MANLGETTVRIVVEDPPPGVMVAVQWGKTGANFASELIRPSEAGAGRVAFDVPVKVTTGPDGAARLVGPAIQGPTGDRFIYVNWGTCAGQHGTPITRRAKVRIGTLTPAQIEAALAPGKRLETAFAGVGKDGGPACATIPLIGGWRVVS
ncbi:hypothetical protein QO010_002353 [Caulobacter ginsengisoli]|uniref:DUF4232 domain-containing protein n=1 Tax=Caulobacter ginsengisoli TaxID=400775 RepID=A0ABU0IRG7_9CAUL|nr:DUF5990 family protein [Caulobacter ginsengisoli]MDQ0464569.1 hypothetical protein [Caulobacter ginsengisoli]